MPSIAERIAALASSLGTVKGMEIVNLEIELLNLRIAANDLPLSSQELGEMSAALTSLSGAIVNMRHVALAMLAEAGVATNRVG